MVWRYTTCLETDGQVRTSPTIPDCRERLTHDQGFIDWQKQAPRVCKYARQLANMPAVQVLSIADQRKTPCQSAICCPPPTWSSCVCTYNRNGKPWSMRSRPRSDQSRVIPMHHRTACHPGWVYGFPELAASAQAIIQSRARGQPGCYANGGHCPVAPANRCRTHRPRISQSRCPASAASRAEAAP